MTPKEKSDDLLMKFSNPFAKSCALILVDEMLNEYPSQVPKDSYEMERHLYWQEVKQEIEKL